MAYFSCIWTQPQWAFRRKNAFALLHVKSPLTSPPPLPDHDTRRPGGEAPPPPPATQLWALSLSPRFWWWLYFHVQTETCKDSTYVNTTISSLILWAIQLMFFTNLICIFGVPEKKCWSLSHCLRAWEIDRVILMTNREPAVVYIAFSIATECHKHPTATRQGTITVSNEGIAPPFGCAAILPIVPGRIIT